MPAIAIAQMSKYSNRDHYIDAVTGVLKNRLGITTEIELEKAEANFAGLRSYNLMQSPIQGKFDLTHLKAIHRYLFQDVYEWAGECRDIDIAKGDYLFAHHTHIETAVKDIFAKLACEKYLSELSESDFCNRAACYFGEINALHPFGEGNGCAQREFINHLAYANGYYIEWKNIRATDMIQASVESIHGDCSKLAADLCANLKKLDRAFIKEPWF